MSGSIPVLVASASIALTVAVVASYAGKPVTIETSCNLIWCSSRFIPSSDHLSPLAGTLNPNDIETDKYNVLVGYEGRAIARVAQLETIEQNGDVITWQDLQTGESRQVVVEQVTFTRQTPPDRGFSGYGGIIDILIRTV